MVRLCGATHNPLHAERAPAYPRRVRRTIIIGDIHGCFDELLELLEKVDLQPDDLLVSVGDLVDRGPAPGAVVGLFRARPNSVAVMGNHERKHVHGIFSYAQEITRLQLGERYTETVDWMRTLPYYFENDHVRVVHAAMLPGIPPPTRRKKSSAAPPAANGSSPRCFPAATGTTTTPTPNRWCSAIT